MIALISNSCQNHVDIEITNNNYTIISQMCWVLRKLQFNIVLTRVPQWWIDIDLDNGLAPSHHLD